MNLIGRLTKFEAQKTNKNDTTIVNKFDIYYILTFWQNRSTKRKNLISEFSNKPVSVRYEVGLILPRYVFVWRFPNGKYIIFLNLNPCLIHQCLNVFCK